MSNISIELGFIANNSTTVCVFKHYMVASNGICLSFREAVCSTEDMGEICDAAYYRETIPIHDILGCR